MSQVRQAIDLLQKALPSLPIGSEPHKSVLAAIQGVSKAVPPTSEIPGVQANNLRDLQQQAQQGGMIQALMRSMGSGGANPASPGGAAPAGGASPPVGAAA